MRYLYSIIIILVISFGLLLGSAEGGTNIIEFKKKYVTNSPDVCGDKMCDEDSEVYSYPDSKNRHTPLGQYNLGIPIHKITCQPNFVFILKITNWHPACVKYENVQRLVDIGWAASPEELENIFAASVKKETPQFAPLKEYRKVFPLYEGLGMSIEAEIINDEEYMIFSGYGWHGFHNVEITISNELGEIEFMMTQTDPDGILYMPWKIPDTITSGWYQVYATDGIHEYEIDFPIILQ